MTTKIQVSAGDAAVSVLMQDGSTVAVEPNTIQILELTSGGQATVNEANVVGRDQKANQPARAHPRDEETKD